MTRTFLLKEKYDRDFSSQGKVEEKYTSVTIFFQQKKYITVTTFFLKKKFYNLQGLFF
jgi:hypothetical protein